MGTAVCLYCIGICVSVPASTVVGEYYLGSGFDKCLGFALKWVQLTGVCERKRHELYTCGQACS